MGPTVRPLLCRLAFAATVLFATANARAAHFTTLYKFTNGTDGEAPYGGVVQDATGVLYGAAASGGDPPAKQ